MVSTTTKVRPVLTRRSRCDGSTRSGSTVSNFWPVIVATLCVATTLPVTFAMNMPLPRQKFLGLPRHDDFLVRRHDPHLDAATGGVQWHFALRFSVADRIEADAEPVEVRADGGPHGGGV